MCRFKVLQLVIFTRTHTVTSKGAILDQQHRLVEELKMVQLQLQALGAPATEDIASGNIQDIVKPRARPASGATSGG